MKIFNGLIIPKEMEEYFLNRNENSVFFKKINLIHKVLQIKIIQGKYYEYKDGEINYGALCSKEALKILNNFMEKLNITIPSKVTKKEINAYSENLYINKRTKKFVYLCSLKYDYYYVYDSFYNYIWNKETLDKDFDELKRLYQEDRFEFYIRCIKSRQNEEYFTKNMDSYKIKVHFQSNDYDATYLRYLKAIDYIDKAKKHFDRKVKKSKINGMPILDECNNINFSIRENSFLTYKKTFNSEVSKRGHGADYVYRFNEINIYFNKFREPTLDHIRFSLYHEIGHFFHHRYIDSCGSNYRKAEALYVKDYISAFKNTEKLRYYPNRGYYRYVAPPLAINGKRSKTINEDSPSAELFAELFRYNVMYGSKYSRLQKMFPHIDYLISNIIKGRGMKKYISF